MEVNGSVVTTTLAEVGYTFSAEEFLDEAMKVGRRGNLIENYKEIKEARNTGVSFGINRQMDEKVLKKFVKKNVKKCVPVRRMHRFPWKMENLYTPIRRKESHWMWRRRLKISKKP